MKTIITAVRLITPGDQIESPVVVIEDGHIVETGSHRELIAQDGPYAKLFEMQAGRYV